MPADLTLGAPVREWQWTEFTQLFAAMEDKDLHRLIKMALTEVITRRSNETKD